MARSRRSSSRSSSRRKKMVLDWVVNDDTYSTSNITIGNTQTAALPLVYPRYVLQEVTAWNSPGSYAFPDAGRQFVKAVRGVVVTLPSSWAVGSTFRMMMRIVKKPMDFITGEAIVDSTYSLFNAGHANERFVWQHLKNEYYNFGNAWEHTRIHATVNQWLEPEEGLYLIMENQSGFTQNLVNTVFCRSLVGSEAP